ncbi:3-oxoadipyl-CoA thiolase, partial [Serratia marcescens]|nr:3-oxoadipyl-CoA thiolase [Serratia marcescens]
HPLGMSGARLVLSAALELRDRQASNALVTMCVGVGVGVGQGLSLNLKAV